MSNLGSNTDSSNGIDLLTQTAKNIGATDEMIEEALKNTKGSTTDSRKVIGLLELLVHLTSSMTGSRSTSEEPTE